METVLIRSARPDDRDVIWRMLKPTVRGGETYALPRDMSEAAAGLFDGRCYGPCLRRVGAWPRYTASNVRTA